MCRYYISFFVCLFALAACSPFHYSGEQTARAVYLDSSADSASFRKMVDQLVHEQLQKRLDILEWTEQTTVEETFSSPDSTGAQYVMKKNTTTLSKHTQASAESVQTKDEQYQEQIDSVSQTSTVSYIEKEEEKRVKGDVDRIIPWYVWPLLFIAAAIIGLFLWRHKGWFII